jgi:hypothetical protein
MAYKFNNSLGAVICDNCRIIIDADIPYKEYETIYKNSNPNGDYCWRCKKSKLTHKL